MSSCCDVVVVVCVVVIALYASCNSLETAGWGWVGLILMIR
jgi:hypothetical protein